VQATFTNGVLEVSVPLPAKRKPEVRKVEVQEAGKPTKAA
jgi:HSP20 family molecular chaperone IbpA